mgnify:CR=1 FL=1
MVIHRKDNGSPLSVYVIPCDGVRLATSMWLTVIITVIEAYLVDAVPTVKGLQEEQHRTVRGFTLLLFK